LSGLIIRAPNWLGDAVMALPAMSALRASFPDSRIAVAATRSIAPLFEERTIAAVDEVIALPDTRAEAKALDRSRFQTIVLLPNSFRSAWMARRAGIQDRWGYSANVRGWMLTRAIKRPRQKIHQSAYYLELVRGLGFSAPDRLPRVEVSAGTLARADRVLDQSGVRSGARLVGFAPGAVGGHAKRWPPRRVVDVILRLTREAGAVCVLLGVEADRDAGREIESSLPPDVRVVNLIGRTDLRALAGVLARSSAFVSNDSGAMHLAAAVGVPVTAIFGPTDDRVTSPLGEPGVHDMLLEPVFCRPCMLLECPIDHRCMKRITTDRVFESVARHLAGRPREAGEART
jgi:lipopolysaccharide heptosyltransferase II